MLALWNKINKMAQYRTTGWENKSEKDILSLSSLAPNIDPFDEKLCQENNRCVWTEGRDKRRGLGVPLATSKQGKPVVWTSALPALSSVLCVSIHTALSHHDFPNGNARVHFC